MTETTKDSRDGSTQTDENKDIRLEINLNSTIDRPQSLSPLSILVDAAIVVGLFSVVYMLYRKRI